MTRLARCAASLAFICVIMWPLAVEAASSVLRFGYILSTTSQLGRGEKAFAAEVSKRTAGRYEIEAYPDAMLGGEVAMLKDLQLGTLDLAFITGAPLPNVVPAAGIFNVPFLFADVAAARTVLDGPLGAEYLKAFEGAGLVALAWGENGMRQLTNSKRAIHTPADLKALRIRLPQSDVMVAGFAALGANVERIPFPEVYGVLHGGAIDGQENPVATIISSRFYEVQSHLSLTSHIYDPAVILMSRDMFASLSDADKVSFKAAALTAARESRNAAAEAERNGIAFLEAKGMTVTRDVDRVAFAESIASVSSTFDRMFGRETLLRVRRAAAEARQQAETAGRPAP